jgi:uncharacterized membrane protein
MGSRWANSMELLKASWTVLRRHKSLVIFPIVSGIVTLVMLAALVIPAYFLTGASSGHINSPVLFYVFFFIFYFIGSFVVIFFNTGLIACAQECLRGGDPDFSYGMSVATQNIGKIAGWAAISATVGLILKMIRERGGIIGVVISSLIGFVWALITFFVIPVFVFQGLGVIDSIKESASIFKRTWGENMIARFSLGIIFFLLGLIGLVPLALIVAIHTPAFVIGMVTISIIYWMALAILLSSLNGILSMALYDYAVTGQVPPPYNPQTIAYAFQPKPAKDWLGRSK